jgi:hypothetical protein
MVMLIFEGNMTAATVPSALNQSAPDRPKLLQSAARAAFPAAYLGKMEALPAPLLRACLADMAHLMQPVLTQRAERLQMAVTILVQNQLSVPGTRDALHAVGATSVVDMQTGSLATATEDFRKFAAAIGAPPRLPGLTQAESQIYGGAKQLSNLAMSTRLGVGLAALCVSERVWQWMCAHIADLLSRRHGVVANTALNCFAADRRDLKCADAIEAMIGGLVPSALVERGLLFGADQAVAVLVPLHELLGQRQHQLIDLGL